jgi:hypothetical protein
MSYEITLLEAKILHRPKGHGYLILLSFSVSKILYHDHCKAHYTVLWTMDFSKEKAFFWFLNRLLLILHLKLKKHEIWVFRKGIIMCDPHHLLCHPQVYFHYGILYKVNPKDCQVWIKKQGNPQLLFQQKFLQLHAAILHTFFHN